MHPLYTSQGGHADTGPTASTARSRDHAPVAAELAKAEHEKAL